MKSLKIILSITGLMSAAAALGQTYYWGGGTDDSQAKFTGASWYENQDRSGSPTTVDFSAGDVTIDRTSLIEYGSNNQADIGFFGTLTLKAWNDTISNGKDWHMYFGQTLNLIVDSMLKTSSSALILRAAGSATGVTLTVNDTVDIQKGSLLLGTTSGGQTGGGSYALYSATMGTLNATGGSNVTMSIAEAIDIGTLNLNGASIYLLNGKETSAGNSLYADIGTLNVGAKLNGASSNMLSASAYKTTVTNMNLTKGSSAVITNSNQLGFYIKNLNIDSTFSNGNSLNLNGSKPYTITKLTATAGESKGGLITLGSSANLRVEESVHTGSGTRPESDGDFNFAFQGASATLEAMNVKVTNGALVYYGSWWINENDVQFGIGLKDVKLRDVYVDGGSTFFVRATNSLSQYAAGTIKASGLNTAITLMAGSSTGEVVNLNGKVVLENGASLTVRRNSGANPKVYLSSLELISGADGGSLFKTYQDIQYAPSGLKIDNIAFTNGIAGATTVGSASSAELTTHTSSADIAVGTVSVGDYAAGNIKVKHTTVIDSVTVGKVASLSFYDLVSTAPVTITNNYTNSGRWLSLADNTKLTVNGNFINDADVDINNVPCGLDVNLGTNASLAVLGYLQNDGIINLGASGVGKVSNYTFGGITNTYDVENVQRHRIYLESGHGTANITLNVAEGAEYIYSNRIHTFGTSMDPSTAVSQMNFVKNGLGTQYFASNHIYYKGTTTINAGALYICANGFGNTAKKGIGDVVLNGGTFGACGVASSQTAVDAVGLVKAESFTWSNAGEVAVDFSGATCDLIELSGDFKKAASDTGGAYNFLFDGSMSMGKEYALITWEGSTDFVESDFTYTPISSVIDGSFIIKDNTLFYATIPEPATYAALFGFAALAIAAWKRRRLGK